MERKIDRRTVLMIAGAATVAAAAGAAAAESEIRGEVTSGDGKAIPEGVVEIYLDDPALAEPATLRATRTRATSDGAARSIAFSLALPAGAEATRTLRVVARLERADGWLLARGSATVEPGAQVTVPLSTVMY